MKLVKLFEMCVGLNYTCY